jgi:nucleoid DNA-binding protein
MFGNSPGASPESGIRGHGGMHTTTKKDIVDRVAAQVDVHRQVVRRIIQEFLDQMTEELSQGNRIEFRQFGVFEPRVRAARTAQNPRTMQPVVIPPHWVIKFKIGAEVRARMEANGHAAASLNGVEVKPRPKRKP